MEDFNEKLIDLIQKKVITDISKLELVKIEYRDRYEVPSGF